MSNDILKSYKSSIKAGYYNLLTPSIISAKVKGNKVFELSRGTDFNHNPIFGASVLKKSGKTKSGFTSAGGKMFRTKKSASNFLTKRMEL